MSGISFSGLSSGLNTNQIIQQLLAIERRPQQRFANRQDELGKKQDAFKDLNNRLNNLQNEMDALLNPDTFNQKKLSNNKESVLSASVVDENQLQPGTFEIFVENLATKASRTSGKFINDQKMFDSNRGTTSISDFEQVEGSGTVDLTSTNFLGQLSKQVETSGDATPEVRINFTNTGNFTEFDLDSFNTFQEFIDAVNNHADNDDGSGNQALKFGFDKSRDKFFFVPLTQDGNGGNSFRLDDNQMALTDSSKGFFQQVGIADSEATQTFDSRQSNANLDQNLLTIDPSSQFQNNLFTSALQTDAGELEVNVNNTSIVLQETDTINDFLQQVNDNVEGVTATFNSATDKINLKTEDEGAGSIEVSDVRGNLADVLNLRAPGNETGGQAGAAIQNGQDSQITIDGTTVTEGSNTITFNGIELNLLSLHTQTNNSGDPVKIEIAQDKQATANAVSDFVKQFNSVIGFINERSIANPPSEPGEQPDQEAGVFAGDGTIRRLKNTLTRIVTDRFSNATGSSTIQDAGSIGIEQKDPTAVAPTDRGKLNFNASKFKSALENEPNAVQSLFDADTATGDAQDGIATRLESFTASATNSNDGLITTRIDGFDTTIANLQDRIERNEERVQAKREVLESKFLQMEQILTRLQGQQSFLSARL